MDASGGHGDRRGALVPDSLLGLPEPWAMVNDLDRALAIERLPADVFHMRAAIETLARCFRYRSEDDPDPMGERWLAEADKFQDEVADIAEALSHRFTRFEEANWADLDAYLGKIIPELFPEMRIDADLFRRCGEIWVAGCAARIGTSVTRWMWKNQALVRSTPSLVRRLFDVLRTSAFTIPDPYDVDHLVFDLAELIDEDRARTLFEDVTDDFDLTEDLRIRAEDRLNDLDGLGPNEFRD